MNYLIYGTSYKLIQKEIKNIIKSNDYKTYSLIDNSIEEIIEDANYTDLFENEKTIVIKDADSLFESKKNNAKYLEILLNYLGNPNSSTNLILICSNKLNEKSYKDILNKLKVITTPIITKPYELAKALEDIIKKDGYAIDYNALNNFANKCSSNIDIALMEFDKLKMIKNNKLITANDIEEYVSNYNTSDIFGFKDALINKNIPLAINMLEDLETSKMEVVPICIMLENEYELLYTIKVLAKEKLSNDDIGAKLDKMHPFRVKVLRETSNKYTLDELQKHILYLCNLNLKLVSEDNLGFDEIRKFISEL